MIVLDANNNNSLKIKLFQIIVVVLNKNLAMNLVFILVHLIKNIGIHESLYLVIWV